MDERIKKARRDFDQEVGKRCQVENDLKIASEGLNGLLLQTRYCEEAQTIIQTVAQLTQEELQYHVGELVTLALASVFEDPCELEVDFVQRRGRVECDLWFVQDGHRIDPLDGDSGGMAEVAAFALRVALWSLGRPRSRATMILDEPLKWLKGESLPAKGAAMIKEISDRMGLQIIMISHIPDQIEGADQRIHIKKVGNYSTATTM